MKPLAFIFEQPSYSLKASQTLSIVIIMNVSIRNREKYLMYSNFSFCKIIFKLMHQVPQNFICNRKTDAIPPQMTVLNAVILIEYFPSFVCVKPLLVPNQSIEIARCIKLLHPMISDISDHIKFW